MSRTHRITNLNTNLSVFKRPVPGGPSGAEEWVLKITGVPAGGSKAEVHIEVLSNAYLDIDIVILPLGNGYDITTDNSRTSDPSGGTFIGQISSASSNVLYSFTEDVLRLSSRVIVDDFTMQLEGDATNDTVVLQVLPDGSQGHIHKMWEV